MPLDLSGSFNSFIILFYVGSINENIARENYFYKSAGPDLLPNYLKKISLKVLSNYKKLDFFIFNLSHGTCYDKVLEKINFKTFR